jgi:hypothetical protein
MRLRVLRSSVLLGFLTLGFSGVGQADLLVHCGTCQGATYLLQYDPARTITSGGVSTYDVSLTIDPSGYNGGGLYINSVAIKIASSEAATGNSVVSAPGAAGSWTLQLGGLNSGGCDGHGSGFICAKDGMTAPVPVNPAYVAGTKYTWEFHYATSASLFTGTLASSVKVDYVDAKGKKVGALVSEGITLQTTPVPDGGMTVMFLCSAVVGLEALRRRLPR